MKYLICTNHSYMLWQFRREVIAALLERGEVVISTPFEGHENDFAAMGCRMVKTEIDRRGVNPVKDLQLLSFYGRLLREEQPDMVITYSIKPNVYAGRVCRRLGIPYCVNVQGLGTAFQKPAMAAVATALYKCGTKRAKTLFFENAANRDEFIARGISEPERTTLLTGAGVNTEHFTFAPYPEENGTVHFLFLGRIMKEKGMDELFAAACAMKEKYGDRVAFDLVGFFDGNYEEAVKAMVRDHIAVYHGFRVDPRPCYAAAHCIVMPSYHEGMSNVLLEAAATGRALITTNIPGCREAVEDGVTGLLCERRNTADLTEKLERFLALTPEERAAMGAAGRKKIEAEFDRREVLRRTLAAIDR